jgi:hypothetical protein
MISSINLQSNFGLGLAILFYDEYRGKSAKPKYIPLIHKPKIDTPVVVSYVLRLL